ncbi:rCG55997 [Rattus norvegicus]|uniref:RCG55997 n=1 Tax=Rattus norvegicus TaxID=10116 RepID=A6IBM2_RAT|nr:rCG55997 [Rattus norvegicus]
MQLQMAIYTGTQSSPWPRQVKECESLQLSLSPIGYLVCIFFL